MAYRVWDNGVIRDATPEEIEEMEHLPPPFDEEIPVEEQIEQEATDDG